MSFEDDMIEDGFHDEQKYLDYICDEADKYAMRQMYDECNDFDEERDSEYETECRDILYQGESLMNYGRYSEAIECFSKITHVELEDVYKWDITHPLVLTGNCHIKLEQYSKAIESYNQYIKLVNILDSNIQEKQEEDEAYWYNGHYMDDNDSLHAETNVYEQIGDCYKELNQHDDAIKFYQQAGDYYYEENKYSEAILCYEKSISLDTTYTDAYQDLINCYDTLNNNLEVVNCYERLIANNPDDEKVYKGAGDYYYNGKNYSEAIKFYEKSIKINPKYTDVYYNLVNCFFALEMDSKIKDCYTELIKNNPDDNEANERVGNYYLELKQYSKAIVFFQKSNAYTKLGDCCIKMKRYPEAIESYKHIVKWNVENIYQNCNHNINEYLYLTTSVDKADVYERLGLCFRKLKKYSESFICYENAASYYIKENGDNWKECIFKATLCYLNLSEINPNDSQLYRNVSSIYTNIGYCYSELGRGAWKEQEKKIYYQKAISYYIKAIEISFNDKDTYSDTTLHYKIGYIYRHYLHSYLEAIPYYKMVIDSNMSNCSEAKKDLKYCYITSGQYAKAIMYAEDKYEAEKYHDEAIKINPSDVEAHTNMEKFKVYNDIECRNNEAQYVDLEDIDIFFDALDDCNKK